MPDSYTMLFAFAPHVGAMWHAGHRSPNYSSVGCAGRHVLAAIGSWQLASTVVTESMLGQALLFMQGLPCLHTPGHP